MNKTTAESLQAIEAKANRLPSPPSRLINGIWVNVCPKCGLPCSVYPWSCKCGWEASKDATGCCTAINEVRVDKDVYEYPVKGDYADSKELTAQEKATWSAAVAVSVEPIEEPLKEPAEPVRKP